MTNLKIHTKLLLTGITISLVLLLVIMFTVLKQNKSMIEIGEQESLRLAYGDLEHIVNNLYSLAESHQEVTQKNIVSALKVARELMNNSGEITFSPETVQWNAINQYTKSVNSIELPKMLLGQNWFGQIYSQAKFTPLVDPIRDMLNVTCTVFQRMNPSGDMLRIATNVKKVNGLRAIGTYIPSVNPDGISNPVISTILRGETFKGRAYVVNKWYITAYEPIYDDKKNVVGVLYVGIPQENVESLRKAIQETVVGKTGFVTVIDSSGEFIISNNGLKDGQNDRYKKDANGKQYINERIKTAVQLKPREIGSQKFIHTVESDVQILRDTRFVYFKPWDWIIAAEADEQDFTQVATRLSLLGDKNNLIIVTASFVILAFTIIIWFVISRSITNPINNLVSVFSEYAAGNKDIRADETSGDEIGYVAKEFNTLLDNISKATISLQLSEKQYKNLFSDLQKAIGSQNYTFRFDAKAGRADLIASLNEMLKALDSASFSSKNQTWLKEGEAHLNSIISSQRNLNDLCGKALLFLANYVGAQVGTFFITSSNSNEYSLLTSYAYKKRKGLSTTFKIGEGLVGQAALEKETVIFSDIPEDYIWIESSLGNTPPRFLTVVPLVYEEEVKGVIELGAVSRFSKIQIDFIDLAAKLLAIAMNTALFNEKLEILLEQTKEQAKELEEQQEELKTANEELQEHTEILKTSEAKLQLQQEELQASNEELEEKTEILEGQKTEITEKNAILRRKQVEVEEKARQLELATKYKSEFLANMSHELRTPLNSLLILAKLLSENEEENLTEDQVESANAIYKGGKNLLYLINNILDLSKIEARKIDLIVGVTSIETICQNCHAEFSHMAQEKNLSFEINLAENLPQAIQTDEHRFNQVIRNLIGNAIKFTDKGGVTLSIHRPALSIVFNKSHLKHESTIAFQITDTGIGITQENIDAIFEAFTQADGSISRRHGGTGLGLSISKELAVILGGELSATSTLGQGSTFTFYIPEQYVPFEIDENDDNTILNQLPAQQNDHTQSEELQTKTLSFKATEQPKNIITPTPLSEDEETKHFIASQGKTILIIEDDSDFANVLSNFFNTNGYESIIAPDGETGISLIAEHQPTAIVLDIGLPGIDGWAVLSELKENPATRHIPVHILSGYDETRQGLEKGAVGYLTKPIETSDLNTVLARIETVLQDDVRRLLIVEDDTDLQSNLLKVMRTKDINAETASNGEQAIKMLSEKDYDCMILDLGLPDISGFELLDTIQSSSDISEVPVIIYTGRELSLNETNLLEKYASSIVLKSAASIDRLLDETALFMHRVEANIPEDQRKMIQKLRDRESVLTGKTVLVVDDDMRNALALNKFLKTKGMDVIIADNGQRALDILDDDQLATPDIVLMDIMMPVMNGYEAMELIREHPTYKDLPILALTAKAMDSDRDDCINAGANDYLSKPVDTSKLLTMLRVWLYS